LGNARIASIGGRYYAMDRDGRWERVHRAWEAIVESRGDYRATDAHSALLAAYARGENDEFVAPTVIEGAGQVTGGDASIDRPRICGKMQDGDTVVFMNFRADRARQLTAAFVASDFSGFIARRPALSRFVGLTQYDARLPAEVAFASDDLRHSIGELVSDLGLRQLRIAETEKYAHVTFFFSGGREAPFAGEDRVLVPSPRVATYDLAPEMSCPEVTARLCEAIRRDTYALLVCNLANADMVGHTGNMTAAIRAVETIDAALGEIEAAVHAAGAALLITADHGNIEQMHDAIGGQAHTAHTVGPVPLVCVGVGDVSLRGGGALRDVAPTLLQLLRLPQPPEMSGRSLFETV
ncbi:MAG TPA: 2,3-bisphosphoglycerate-independent phosphoglycerate mutase, partial [Xanthomonadaceae bacterium]|nr:2,3-bisphosphoglycerate-independent phosphoglycerate mutase [Xanthomonadaceae bacterium]